MNVLFLSISPISHMSGHSISQDLLREFCAHGHQVFVVCALDRRSGAQTTLSHEAGCTVLRVRIGKNKKASLIEKGLTTVSLPYIFIREIKKNFADVKFDLVLYPTPPITHAATVAFVKRRDGAESFLMLRDIFPQNAVDIGMMAKTGPKAPLYRYFRGVEKELYRLSDRIGCMSPANVEYLLRHNPDLDPAKVTVLPNSIEVEDVSITPAQRAEIREKYAIPLDKKVFVYGGNLGKPQGIPFFLSCLERLKDHRDSFFLIVGDGTEFGRLQEFIDGAGADNLRLLKRLPREDYDRMVPACDVGLIFLDHRFTIPNFPSRLLSYMQAGLPVLAATDVNTDVGKVITEGNFGWWCESSDPDAFCALVDKALSADLEEMGNRGTRYLLDHYQTKDAYRVIVPEE